MDAVQPVNFTPSAIITIRPRRVTDLEACATILRAVHADSGYPASGTGNAISFIEGQSTLQAWVAEVNGVVAGHALVGQAHRGSPAVALWQAQGRPGRLAAFNRLFVDPACRGRGITRMLEAAALEYARQYSLRLLLYVLEKDPEARQLYERWGWEYFGDNVFRLEDGQMMRAYCYASPIM